MTRNGRPWRQADLSLATALARGSSNSDASREAGVSQRTLYRRLHDREFCRLVEEIRDEAIGKVSDQLSEAAGHAVATLRQLLSDGTESTKLKAAATTLEFGLRVREQLELMKRIKSLEESREHRQ